MLTIELVSDSEVFEYGPGQSVLVYVNEKQFIQVMVAKVLNCTFFYIHINGKKEKINKVRIIYKAV